MTSAGEKKCFSPPSSGFLSGLTGNLRNEQRRGRKAGALRSEAVAVQGGMSLHTSGHLVWCEPPQSCSFCRGFTRLKLLLPGALMHFISSNASAREKLTR